MATEPRFEIDLMGRRTALHECESCGSLQTDKPDWLDAAYAYEECAHPADTGYMTRNLQTADRVDRLLQQLKLPKSATVLDWGGGIGILARLLRERGWNAFSHDRHKPPVFPGLAWSGEQPDVVLAVEVFEHLADPAHELAELFALEPALIYVTTLRYSGEGPDWWYLSPESGQHVFFYSDRAMDWLARKYGYRVMLPSPMEAVFSTDPVDLRGLDPPSSLHTTIANRLRRLYGRLKLLGSGRGPDA